MLERKPFLALSGLLCATRTKETGRDALVVSSLLDGNHKYVFSMSKVHRLRRNIAGLLAELPDCLMQQPVPSPCHVRWIEARRLKNGQVWANSLREVDMLLALGRAARMVTVCPPPDKDSACDMPCVMVMKRDAMHRESLLPVGEQNRDIRYWQLPRH